MTDHRPEIVFKANSPGKVLSAVPSLLGFTPGGNDLVLMGLVEPSETVVITMRVDMPTPAELAERGTDILCIDLAMQLTAILVKNDIPGLCAVYYGSNDLLGRRFSDALRGVARTADLYVKDVLRVDNGRYWSYVCNDPTCCPPEGTPFVMEDVEGFEPVLFTREAIAATVAPRADEAAEAMRKEVVRAAADRKAHPRRFIDDNLVAIAEFIANYRGKNEMVPIGVVANLFVALTSLRVRDDAWARMDPKHTEAHIRLWTHLTRIAPPGYVAAPASLLAFVAWQSGNTALSHCALDRAQADDPDYRMAELLRQAISAGIPPNLARLPMSPEEVADGFAEDDDNEE